jgi:hypothetical protein
VRKFGNGAIWHELLALNVVLGRCRADVVSLQRLQRKSAQLHCDVLESFQSPLAKVSLGLKKKESLRVELFEHRDVASKVPARGPARNHARCEGKYDLRARSSWRGRHELRLELWLAAHSHVHGWRERGHGVCVVWCGVVWCGVVWCGVVWCGVV